MFTEASSYLYNLLTTNLVFSNLFGNKLFVLYAFENTAFPFATYQIRNGGQYTKDGNKVDFSLFLWFENNQTTECMAAHDAVYNILKEDPYIEFDNEDTSFLEFDTEILKPYAQINFSINL